MRLLAGLVVALAVLVASPAVATPPQPDGADAWFGPVIDTRSDSLADYAARLGADPSLVSVELGYPLDEDARAVVRDVATDAAALGTVVVLDARPLVPLADLTPGDADDLARALRRLERDRGVRFLVRFAPEMNGSWETWGQQPRDFVAAFRTVADALHADTDAGTVWAPVYGSGYPFRAVDGADGALDEVLERDRPSLDTSGDDRLDAADDPYGPYYPGDAAVDWVGLSMYRLGQSQALRRNAELPGAELRLRLDEQWGYGDDRTRRPFVDRFATTVQPLLLGTAAPYNPAVGGDPEIEVKRQWWRQLLSVVDADDRIGGVTWLEVRRTEPEVDDVVVEWRATASPAIAKALRRDLRASERIELAPVYEVRDRDTDLVTPQPAGPAPGADPTLDDRGTSPAWWWLGCGLLLVLALVAGLLRPRWLEVDGDVVERDPRLDVVRGSILLGSLVALVVTLGLDVGSLPGWLVVGAVGTLLAVSGAAHMLAEHRLVEVGGSPAAVSGHLKRAVVVYLAAVALTVLHLLLDALPGVTSPFGSYADAALLLDYPPPGTVTTDLLALRVAPGPVVLLGLFAVLAVLAAAVGPACRRGGWWILLGASWLVFALGAQTGWQVAALGWETGWPLLVWQLPFVHAMVAVHLLLTSDDLGRRVALGATGVVGLASAAWGACVLVGLAPDVQPTMVVALISATTVIAVAVLGWGLIERAFGWSGAAGRHPLAVTGLLLLVVVGASMV
ncbi:hypothetical protein GCM10009623_37410 [Nocardioides aestuarii]|uniref:OpgC domain-containing protein n=1 Tax=Nocardioides aestuarii TaxID=252231 RepID=A0ABW4TUI5_9ACTN